MLIFVSFFSLFKRLTTAAESISTKVHSPKLRPFFTPQSFARKAVPAPILWVMPAIQFPSSFLRSPLHPVTIGFPCAVPSVFNLSQCLRGSCQPMFLSILPLRFLTKYLGFESISRKKKTVFGGSYFINGTHRFLSESTMRSIEDDDIRGICEDPGSTAEGLQRS
ncbi:uncharacterized protein LOC130979098 [Arachis stenosperma]|uniref:uncharacterized protein LOC130979098 n=1 Tax=Arachis stenosperma TaxID=217475 RepID=UPI0025AD88E9|nr:uncharacterized protein LOC130979098 [Arachis stenosperma]